MAKIGYARSLQTENLKMQIKKLEDYGCDKIIYEKVINTRKPRKKVETMFSTLKEGDIIVFTEYDKIIRTVPNLIKFIKTMNSRKIDFISIEQKELNEFLHDKHNFKMLEMCYDIEYINRLEITDLGRQVARDRGVYLGRPTGMTEKSVEMMKEIETMMKDQGMTITEIAKKYNTCRAQIYNLIKKKAELDSQK